ncbi:MAG: hypothetical protein V1827_04470 [Candidatus Micrarchaeota archaeon]
MGGKTIVNGGPKAASVEKGKSLAMKNAELAFGGAKGQLELQFGAVGKDIANAIDTRAKVVETALGELDTAFNRVAVSHDAEKGKLAGLRTEYDATKREVDGMTDTVRQMRVNSESTDSSAKQAAASAARVDALEPRLATLEEGQAALNSAFRRLQESVDALTQVVELLTQ